MNEDNQSKISLYSLGYAAGNLEFGQRELEVIPIESLSQFDGEVNDMRDSIESTGKDREGNEYKTKQETSHSIVATYMPNDANRPFPGLVRRGERVLIYRVGDTDKFYWAETGLDDTIRRQDVFVIAIPNSPKENENSREGNSAYYIEVNTVDKHISIRTNKNDGEAYAYDVQLNGKGGFISLQDDVGNFIQLVSKEQRVILGNAAGSEIKIEKSKALISAKDEVQINTNNFKVNAKTTTFTGSSWSVKASAEFTGSLKSNGVNVSNTHYHTSTKPGDPTTKVTG